MFLKVCKLNEKCTESLSIFSWTKNQIKNYNNKNLFGLTSHISFKQEIIFNQQQEFCLINLSSCLMQFIFNSSVFHKLWRHSLKMYYLYLRICVHAFYIPLGLKSQANIHKTLSLTTCRNIEYRTIPFSLHFLSFIWKV